MAKRITPLQFVYIVLLVLGLTAFWTVGILLAGDVFTIPYLSPLAHFAASVLSPFLPLVAPLSFGVFLKVCKHESWPTKKLWLFITGSQCIQHLARVSANVMSLYKGRTQCGRLMICGLDECTSAWTEETLLLAIIVATWMGWNWDIGYVDLWIAGLVKNDEEQKRKKKQDDIEKAARVDQAVGSDIEKSTVDEKAAGLEQAMENDMKKDLHVVDETKVLEKGFEQ